MSQWMEAASVAEFEHTDRKMVDFGGNLQIGLFKVGAEFFAISAWCSHQRATMVHGDIVDHTIECPLHGARFCLRTGKQLCLPAVRPVAHYDTKVEDGKVLVKVG